MNMTDEEIIAYWRGAYDRMAARSIEDGAKIAKLEAENERLRAALMPFAEEARRFDGIPASMISAQQCWFTVPKFLDARKALEASR